MKQLTLCFIFQDGQILLGMKKRGFGQGKWNGYGGKVEKGETTEEAMKREVLEEVGLKILHFEKVGIVRDLIPNLPQPLEVHIFVSKETEGSPIETEEMTFRWFKLSEIPFHSMWGGDKYWIPLMLKGEKLDLYLSLDERGEIVSFQKFEG